MLVRETNEKTPLLAGKPSVFMKLGVYIKDLGKMNKDKIKLNFKLMGKRLTLKMFDFILLPISTGFYCSNSFTSANLTKETACLLDACFGYSFCICVISDSNKTFLKHLIVKKKNKGKLRAGNFLKAKESQVPKCIPFQCVFYTCWRLATDSILSHQYKERNQM